MTPESLSLGAILRTRFPLVVPPYQRAYAWEREEITDFVADIHELWSQRERGADVHPQFFGGVVSVHSLIPGSTAGGEYRVVDGQQRLATFTFTIANVLRAYEAVAALAAREQDSATQAEATAHATVERGQLLQYQEVVGGSTVTRLRLRLSKIDDDYFKSIVFGRREAPGNVASHKRLAYAERRIDRELIRPIVSDTSRSPRQKLDSLRNLLQALVDDCVCIHIISQEPGEAYRLFATLNDRGRALTDGDLLRTRTLELLEGWPDQQETVEKAWEPVLTGSYAEVDKFLRDRYASVVGIRAPSRDLYDRYKDRFLASDAPGSEHDAEAIVSFVRKLRDEAPIYQALRAGEWPYDDSVVLQWHRDRLSRLVVTLGQETCLPLLLSLRCEVDEKVFVAALLAMERLSFRYLAVGAHAGSLGDQYYRHAAAVRHDPTAFDVPAFVSDIEEFVARVAGDDVFRTGLRSRIRYSASTAQRRLVKHLLTTLDDFYPWESDGDDRLTPKTMGHYDLDAIEIEHIYPQNPPPAERISELDELKHDIGNLSFWDPSDNKDAGNGSYAGTKRPLYEASKVQLNTHLAARHVEWNREQLEARADELIAATLRIYSLDTAPTHEAPTDEELEENLLTAPVAESSTTA